MSRDPQKKIDRILAAAQQEFARAGLAGARVDAIAGSAGMNKRLLYHYVGNKDALFDATVRHCITRLADGRPDEGSEPWRVLCHAVASERAPDFGPLIDRLVGLGSGADAARKVVGGMLLDQLLPDLAVAIDQALPSGTDPESGSKPRVKMMPTVRGI